MDKAERGAREAEVRNAQARALRACRKANRLEIEFWNDVRATTTPCAITKHDVEKLPGEPFTLYRCRVCGDEEWL